MHKDLPRLCILGCVFLAQLSPATAYCAKPGSGQQECHPIKLQARSLGCAVGNNGAEYKPLIQDHRFQGSDFSGSCLVNAGVTCANPENAGQHPIEADTSCCSCYLYAKHCHNQPGKFVTAGGSDHTLVMPTSACTGIENYNSFGCPGESIWDEGHDLLTSAGRDATWGMSINPVSRRGQHQMHVHLAQVDSTLMASIVKGVGVGHKQFYVDCDLAGNSHGKSRLDKCKHSASPCKNCPEVHIKHSHTKPSGAAPFHTAYGPRPTNNNLNVLHASTLVLKLPHSAAPDTWAVVINPYGPAECFFADKKGSDLAQACPQ